MAGVVGGVGVTVSVGRAGVEVRVGRLDAALPAPEAALLTAPLTPPLPHPAARDPMARIIAATASPFVSRCIPVLPSSARPRAAVLILTTVEHERQPATDAARSPHPPWVDRVSRACAPQSGSAGHAKRTAHATRCARASGPADRGSPRR